MKHWARDLFLATIVLAGGCTQGEMVSGELETDIIGGQPTLPGDFPATGALLSQGIFRCTATLIAPDVILTAAHCLISPKDLSFTLQGRVPLTANNATMSDGADGGVASAGMIPADELYPVAFSHMNPGFDSGGGDKDLGQVNDVGVAILARPVLGVPYETVDTHNYDVGPGSELQLTGYGVTAWYLIFSAGIKHDAMVLVDGVGDYEIRLSAAAAEAQACKGDSGGPLFNMTGSHTITALVSRSAGDTFQCNEGSIATRVAPYAAWIADASQDRESGCSVGGRGGAGSALTILLGWILVAFRRRPQKS